MDLSALFNKDPNLSFIHGALGNALQTYKGLNEARYAPMKSQADILSKAAYSAYSPYSYLSSALKDPLVVAQLKESGQLAPLLERFQHMPTDPMQGLRDAFHKPGGSWLDRLAGSVFGQQQSAQPQTQSQEAGAPTQSPTSAPAEEPIVATQPGSFTPVSGEPGTQVYQGAPPGTPGLVPPTVPNGPVNAVTAQRIPLSEQGIGATAAQKGSEEAATETAKTNVDTFQDILKQDREEIEHIPDQMAFTNQFSKAYDDAWAKGGWLNVIPEKLKKVFLALDSDAVTAGNAANNVAINRGKQLYGTKDSDYRQSMVNASKFDITMNPKTKKDVVALQELMQQRTGEHLSFDRKLVKDYGITDPSAMREAWYDYNVAKKFWDKDSKELHPEMLNTYPQWMAKRFGGQGKADQGRVPVNTKIQKAGENFLSKGLQLPSFDSKEHFQTWFNQQPLMVQKAVEKHLGGK